MRARRPIGIVTLHTAKVWLLDLDAAPVIHLVCPHQPLVGILNDPNHHHKYSGRHLQSGGIMVGREINGLVVDEALCNNLSRL